MEKMNMSDVRCGAINPYALYKSRTGKKISLKQLTPGQISDKFEDEFGLPFHHMFDPAHGSPLFAQNQKKKTTNSVENIEAGEAVSRCGAAVSGWGNFTGQFLAAAPADINDVNQGCSLDCWFIAALASVAWIWPDFIKNYYASTNSNTFVRFSKANHATGATPPYMPPPGGNLWSATYSPTVQNYINSYTLPYNGSAGNYVFASSNPTAPTTSLWAALMEKNYGIFYQLTGSAGSTPDISTFGTGNPLNSLIHLTAKRYYGAADVANAAAQNPPVQLTESAFFMTEFANSNSVFNTIYSKCYIQAAGANPAIIGVPMVAWTYPDSPTANAAAPAGSPPVTYNNDAIVAQHCYSILGVHNVNKTNYIVLRNPWGMSMLGGLGQDPDITDGTVISANSGTVASGATTWTVSLPPSSAANNNSTLNGATSRTINLLNNDGIFAITPAAFQLYFAGFGWVS